MTRHELRVLLDALDAGLASLEDNDGSPAAIDLTIDAREIVNNALGDTYYDELAGTTPRAPYDDEELDFQ